MSILSMFLTIFAASVANAGVLLFALLLAPDLDVTAYLTGLLGVSGIGAILTGLALTIREVRTARAALA